MSAWQYFELHPDAAAAIFALACLAVVMLSGAIAAHGKRS